MSLDVQSQQSSSVVGQCRSRHITWPLSVATLSAAGAEPVSELNRNVFKIF